MIDRMLVAGLALVLSLGGIFAPVEASARSGGFGAGRSIGMGFHRAAVRPFVHVRHAPRPAVLPFAHARHAPRLAVTRPIARPIAVHARAVRFAHMRHHRRVFGAGLPLAGIGVIYGTSYPDDDVAPYQQPLYADPTDDAAASQAAVPAGGDPVAPRTCRSQTQTVPSGRGGETQVTITRC
jgi:hypothetical protein